MVAAANCTSHPGDAARQRKAAVTRHTSCRIPRISSRYAFQASTTVLIQLIDYEEELDEQTNPQTQPIEFRAGSSQCVVIPIRS